MKAFSIKAKSATRLLFFILGILSLLISSAACRRENPSANNTVQTTPSASGLPKTTLPMPPISPALTRTDKNNADSSLASTFTRLDERQMKLADYRGHVVVLDFYATWCPPCREEVPHLVALQKRFGPEGLHIIGLNVGGPEDKAQIPAFVRDYKIQYELGFPAEEMSELYFSDNDTIPQTYVFDRQGRLLKRFIGYDEDMPAMLENIVHQALNAPAE